MEGGEKQGTKMSKVKEKKEKNGSGVAEMRERKGEEKGWRWHETEGE